MTQPNEDEEFLGLDEAVAALKSSRSTVYRWLRTGALNGVKSGRQWLIRRDDIERFLRGEGPRVDTAPGVASYLAGVGRLLAERGESVGEDGDIPESMRAVVATAQLALVFGVTHFAMEPHLADGRVEGWLRMRIDGQLDTHLTFDVRALKALVEGWKRWAGCDPHKSGEIQTGRAVVAVGGEGDSVDFRVTILPTVMGEAVSVAVADPEQLATHATLDRLDYAPADRARIDEALGSPWGMTIVTGPTGAGKSTFLYAALAAVADPHRETIAIEASVECRVPGVLQLPVQEDRGVTFPAALRAALECDPDVVMVGELRDYETMEKTVATSLSGHLVLTALHAPDAVAALGRMTELGLDSGAVGEATRAIVAQRLVRRLCPSCSTAASPTDAELREAVSAASAGGIATLGRDWKEAVGCSACGHTGYQGRRVIAETLVLSGEVRRALRSGASLDELRKIAVAEGMTTLVADGIRRAADGVTTLQEVWRVV